MKCPVCETGDIVQNGNKKICTRCGYDATWYLEMTQPDEALPPTDTQQPKTPDPPQNGKGGKEHKKLLPLLIAAAAVLSLGLGILIGMGISKPASTDPSESVKKNVMHHYEHPYVCDYEYDEELDEYFVWYVDEAGYFPDSQSFAYSVFGSRYQRWEIASITFLDSLNEMNEEAWDISEAQDGSVMAWVEPSQIKCEFSYWWGDPPDVVYDLYIAGDGGVWAGESCALLFSDYYFVESITFGDAFHTEDTENMYGMFRDCENLDELDLEHFDTSDVQDMDSMFGRCVSLKRLNLGDHFDTSNVQDMSDMFVLCGSLTELNLGDHFDTSNVKDMGLMFYNCNSLTDLILGDRFDTSNVQYMYSMFSDCESLTDLTLGDKFVTTNADTNNMFFNCPAGEKYAHLVN